VKQTKIHGHTTNKSAPESLENPTKNMYLKENVYFFLECYTFLFKKEPNSCAELWGRERKQKNRF